jgi:hypothetical protein
MRRRIERLCHPPEADNLVSILNHGLMSTERLVRLAGISEPASIALLRTHRPDKVRLRKGVVIRDLRPMPPAALAGALEDGLEPADWYALLNSFVFLWSDRERMDRQRRACGNRPQVVLTFDSTALLGQFQAEAFVSPINSGNARRKAAQRGRKTFVPTLRGRVKAGPRGARAALPLNSCSGARFRAVRRMSLISPTHRRSSSN